MLALQRLCRAGPSLARRSRALTGTRARWEASDKDSAPTSENDQLLGSASPWASFDAWGADEVRKFDPEQVEADLKLLAPERLAVGTDPDAPPDDEDVSECLEAYDRILATRSSHSGTRTICGTTTRSSTRS